MVFLLCAGAGALLFLSQPPRRWAAIQIIALAIFIFALIDVRSPAEITFCGLCFAFGQTVPTLLQLRLHPVVGAISLVSQSVLWVSFAFFGTSLWAQPDLLKPFFLAASAAALTWAEWKIVPLWGTTQSWARPWSLLPDVSRFVGFTGVAGAPFAVVIVASCLAYAWRTPLLLLMAAAFCALFWGAGVVLQREKPLSFFKIAVFGWSSGNFESGRQLTEAVASAIATAARSEAKLLVLPETAFQVENRASFRESFAALATKHQISLAVGYFDGAQNRNCLDFFAPDGEVLGRYVKTHLVPVFEKYTRGEGETTTVEIEGTKIGGLICQDDNFSDIAEQYARQQTQILAVPTNDWRAVKDFHFVGALWRALEFRMAIVIAASSGISAICDGNGRVLAACDHFQSGPQLLVAEVGILRPQTSPAAFVGELFPILCGLFAFCAFVWWR